MNRKELTAQGIGSVLARVSAIGSSILLAVVLARMLGPDGYGRYTYVLVIVSVIGILVQLGLPRLVIRETAWAEAESDWPRMKYAWRWSSAVVLAVSLTATVAGAVVVWWFQERLTTSELWTIGLGALLIPATALGTLRGAALQGLRHVALGLLPETVLRPVLFIILLLLLAPVTSPLSPPEAMGLHVIAAFLAFIVGALLLWRYMPPQLRGRAGRFEGTHNWWRASLAFGLAAGANQINNYSDLLVLGMFRPAEEVGYYRVAYQSSTIVGFGLQIVALVVAPHFARLARQSDRERLQKLATLSARLSTFVALSALLVLALRGEELISLVFGGAYSGSVPPLLILACAQLVFAFFGPIAMLLNMSGFEHQAALRTAFCAALNVALNFALIPPLGMEGAALATLLTLLMLNVSLWHGARRLLDVNMIAVAPSLPPRRSV